MDDLNKIFDRIIIYDKDYTEALTIIRQNSMEGNIWLIGSYIYKNLANVSYSSGEIKTKDLDFIVENPNSELALPNNWKLSQNRFGNPKFVREDRFDIDFIPLENIYQIVKRKQEPSIKNFLIGVPLNIHCFAYECNSNKLLGEAGIQSLMEKVVAVNDLEMAQDAAKLYDTTVNEMIRKKSQELGFKAEYV